MDKKILFVTTIVRTAEAFLLPHIKYFKNKGFAVGLAANTEGGVSEVIGKLGVTVHHVPFSRSMMDINNIRAYKAIRRVSKDYSIVHLHTPIASLLTRLAISKNQISIYTAHGFHFNENESWGRNLFFKCMEKIASVKTSKLIVTNQDDLHAAKKLFSPGKYTHVHGVGIDVTEFDRNHFTSEDQRELKSKLGIDPEVKVITHIAEFNENKRQIDVIEACEVLKEWHRSFLVLLIGKGHTQEKIEEEIRKKKLEKHVRCLGFMSDIPSILSITDIGLLVSLREGLPRSVMEMMAMEIPVIATNIRGNRDLVDHGETGYIIPVKSPGEIATKCFALLTNEELMQELGARGREKVVQHFSLPIVLEEMESVYRELFGEI